MKKENAVINIAGLPLGVKNRYDILRQPIFEKFIDKKNGDSAHFFHNRSGGLNLRYGKINGRCPHLSISAGKFISYAYSQLLASNGGMLLHATAVVKDRKAFLFLGIGGSGKSTIAGLSRKYKVLGDDIIAVRKIGRYYYAFSTPWKQSPFITPDMHTKGRISAVFFIKKSDRIAFKLLLPEDALMRILSSHIHFLVYTGKAFTKKIFFTSTDLVKKIPAYEMEFAKTRNFWRVLEEEISVVRP